MWFKFKFNFHSTGSGFRNTGLFKIAIFGHETWQVVKVPELAHTVNSLMFTGINVCVFETRPCSRVLMFAVSSGLDSYLGT